MKSRFTMCLLTLLISAFSFAQSGNGGQYAENNYAKFNYVAYQSGKYFASLSNKQANPCNQFKIEWLGNDTIIVVSKTASPMVIELPGAAVGNTKIRMKPLVNCNNGCDMGWLEIWSPIALPLHFKSFSSRAVNKHL